jgi:predicted phage-related endonuclease
MRKIAPAELPLDHLAELFKKRAHAQRLADQHAAKVKEADDKIKAELGESPYGTIDGVRVVSYTTSQRLTLDTSKLKENHPEIYEALRRPTTVRSYKVLGVEPALRKSTRTR